MHRNKSVNVHQFAMVPKADIPRSSFRMQKSVKKTFDASYLVPLYCQEVLPGDSFKLRMTAFARLATPLVPIMDNMHFESFFFFVPNRLCWTNWVKFMGEQDNPLDSISFTIPQVVSPVAGYPIGTIFDHFGLPTVGQVAAGATISHSVLPLRMYNRIYNDWFRAEDLIGKVTLPNNVGDGPDPQTDYVMTTRLKRHDYFTGCLPWTQKGGVSTPLPLGSQAPIRATNVTIDFWPGPAGVIGEARNIMGTAGATTVAWSSNIGAGMSGGMKFGTAGANVPSLYADLSAATAATINQLRQAFQIQRLLERDARGGTRYAEIVRSHFGVVSPDARLQRPEYLGGGHTAITINPIAQTSATGLTGGATPVGKLAAMGTFLANGHGFSQSFTEHGYIIGLGNVRADLTYQQGLRRHWSRLTRYDFYWPAFAMLGEQAVLNKEIYVRGDANDNLVFGYQERWAEYRYDPSEIHGLFRSTAAGTLDFWHLAERFSALPTLGAAFIVEHADTILDRAIAVPAEPQFLCDLFFDVVAARPMPLYSVPGMIDHF